MTEALLNKTSSADTLLMFTKNTNDSKNADFDKIFQKSTQLSKDGDIKNKNSKTSAVPTADYGTITKKQDNSKKDEQAITSTLGDIKQDTIEAFKELSGLILHTVEEVSGEASLDMSLVKSLENAIENYNPYKIEETEDEEVTSVSAEEIEAREDNSETDESEDTDTTQSQTTPRAAEDDSLKSLLAETNEEEPIILQAQNQEDDTFGLTNFEKPVDTKVEFKPLNEQLYNDKTTNPTNVKPNEKTTAGEEETLSAEDLANEDMLSELNIESIDAETSREDGGNLMRNQTPEEHGMKVMLNADKDFESIRQEIKQPEHVNTSKPVVNPSKILEQITKQLDGLHGSSKVNLVLNPDSLGKVSVQIVNTKEGVSAVFTASTQEAKNLIMKGLDGLKDSLVSQGVSVDNVSVKLEETQQSRYNSDWTEQEGSRGGNKEQGKRQNKENGKSFEQMMFEAENEGNV